MKKLLLFSALLTGLLSSCSTDFDINAPYKETMVIYGFLNKLGTAQYIRISKAFLGEGNALIMAQQPDSFNYSDILDVEIERVNNGSVVERFALQHVDTIPKEEGLFASPYQVYYTTTHPILDDGSLYRLIVTNTLTGTTATSLTRIVKNFVPSPAISSTLDFSRDYPLTIGLEPGDNSKVFDLTIRIHYTETDTSGITNDLYTDWNFAEQVAGESSSARIDFSFQRSEFFKVLGNSIPVKPGIVRHLAGQPLEFRFTVGTEDLYTYERLTQPSSGIVQDRPLFTTIENGVGLFTSRLSRSEFRAVSSSTITAMDTSVYTRDLNFQ